MKTSPIVFTVPEVTLLRRLARQELSYQLHVIITEPYLTAQRRTALSLKLMDRYQGLAVFLGPYHGEKTATRDVNRVTARTLADLLLDAVESELDATTQALYHKLYTGLLQKLLVPVGLPLPVGRLSPKTAQA
jgi:hypothetical protein